MAANVSRLRKREPEPDRTVWLRVCDLIVAEIQRPLDEKRAIRIAKNLDPDLIGVLHVACAHPPELDCEQEGLAHEILDGQHRRGALLHLGWAEQRIECKAHRNLTAARKAQLFAGLNESVKVQPLPRFRARVAANESVAVAIQRILADAGWVVRYGTERSFAAVSAAETVYKGQTHGNRSGTVVTADGALALQDTIRCVTAAWGHDPAAVTAPIILGLGYVYMAYPHLDSAALARKLSSYPSGPGGVVGAAKGLKEFRGGTLPHAVAEIVVALYNKGRRQGALPDWRS